MSGPKRTILSGGHFREDAVIATRHLDVGRTRVDFVSHPEVEQEIIAIFKRYQAWLAAEKDSPSEKDLTEFVNQLHCDTESFRRRLNNPWPELPGPRIMQLRGALAEVLSQAGFSLNSLERAIDTIDPGLRALDHLLLAIQVALRDFHAEDGYPQTDEKSLRERMILKVLGILRHHGLDASTGAKSPITMIIIELEGTHKGDAAKDARHRKSLAAEITKLVKSRKVDE